jgi:hypothetical protein
LRPRPLTLKVLQRQRTSARANLRPNNYSETQNLPKKSKVIQNGELYNTVEFANSDCFDETSQNRNRAKEFR